MVIVIVIMRVIMTMTMIMTFISVLCQGSKGAIYKVKVI